MQPKEYRKRFLVKNGQKLVSIEVDDIRYFFSDGRLNFFKTADNKKFVVDYTMDELEDMLDPEKYFRTSRSFYVSINSIDKIEDYFGNRLILRLKPLVDKYEVDLYLAGHRHVYERHKAIRGTEVFEQADTHLYDKPQGTIYVTNGSCGGSLTGVGGWNLSTMVFTPKEKLYTYGIMTIEGRTINYKVFDKSGNQLDYFTISK